GPTIEEVD
nr:Chain C, HSC70-PEPTIDE [synthetic construct]1ELW_D Chain D, HSC70-PEPTIDE [synthetic construct]3AGY_C Chain C, peptide of Heat shock cognate 71 kDa protein [Homo sapiens]3AGY_D Chain D, peptide of Heat shock cognate 71 kDa protein [Homo sapiens]3AGY_F Chain F, peptide of Heat shock cognate 71 kDa protein [Homo sapiens]3AGZ_C Chain C, peptide of Heat shock cognate 71 kDa protein [Homo sapiens]3AGZ_D Chain D, peptide of Heat shock cognate 71 kDa protein [Homo sapiens]3AGZ_E Chain E, peptide